MTVARKSSRTFSADTDSVRAAGAHAAMSIVSAMMIEPVLIARLVLVVIGTAPLSVAFVATATFAPTVVLKMPAQAHKHGPTIEE